MRSDDRRIAFAAGSRTSSWMSGTPRLLASSTADDRGTSTSIGRADDVLDILDGQAAQLVGLVQHDVPVAGHQPERRQQFELGAHRTQARHAHVRHEDRIRHVLERDERVLAEPGRRVDDDVPECPRGAVR